MKDVIIVLGRGINPDGTLPVDPVSRVKKAVELFNQGIAPSIIMAGGHSYQLKDVPQSSEARAMKNLAISLGVPKAAIFEESRSTHTVGNAYFTKKLFCEPNNWHNVVLVASDEHLPRIEYVFRKMFGPSYNLTLAQSERVLNDDEYQKELEHEKSSMEVTKGKLESVTEGDDITIKGLALAMNPKDSMTDPL